MYDEDENIIYLSTETYEWLLAELEKPPQVLPKLKELIERCGGLDKEYIPASEDLDWAREKMGLTDPPPLG